jgi:hypothetical protein
MTGLTPVPVDRLLYPNTLPGFMQDGEAASASRRRPQHGFDVEDGRAIDGLKCIDP